MVLCRLIAYGLKPFQRWQLRHVPGTCLCMYLETMLRACPPQCWALCRLPGTGLGTPQHKHRACIAEHPGCLHMSISQNTERLPAALQAKDLGHLLETCRMCCAWACTSTRSRATPSKPHHLVVWEWGGWRLRDQGAGIREEPTRASGAGGNAKCFAPSSWGEWGGIGAKSSRYWVQRRCTHVYQKQGNTLRASF